MVKDYAKLHFIVLIWGTTAILGLLIHLPSVEMVLYRTFLASLGLLVLLLLRKRPLAVGTRNAALYMGTGVLIAAHWVLFFQAARISNASVSLVGLATLSFWTSLLEPLVYRRKVVWLEVALGISVIVALWWIFAASLDQALGLVVGLASAFIGSLFTVFNGKFVQQSRPYVVAFYEMMGACLALVLYLPIHVAWTGQAAHLVPSASDIFWLLVLALVATVYAYSASIELMERLSAFAVSLANNLEPLYGVILALLFFPEQESMPPGFYGGGLLLLASVLSYPFLRRWQRLRRAKLLVKKKATDP